MVKYNIIYYTYYIYNYFLFDVLYRNHEIDIIYADGYKL